MNRVPKWERELPEDLWSTNYEYPPALFADWKPKQKVLRFEGSDDIPAPVTNSERTMFMARYAVANSIDVFSEGTCARIARGEIEVGLTTAMRKVWHGMYKSYEGLERGDIELAAEELGVYEILWPFDPEVMDAEAQYVERQFATV